jgi:hypothetical protein
MRYAPFAGRSSKKTALYPSVVPDMFSLHIAGKRIQRRKYRGYTVPEVTGALTSGNMRSWRRARFKSLFKIWNFGVVNAKILPCRLKKSPKIGIFTVY